MDNISSKRAPSAATNYHSGHRKRVKERFFKASPESLTDHELLEIMLFMIVPRIDVKPIVHALLSKFKDLNGIFFAKQNDFNAVIEAKLIKNNLIFTVKFIHEICKRLLITEVKKGTVINSWSALTDYLRIRFGHMDYEQFMVLYLNTQSKLIESHEFGSGTIDESTVYVREVIKTGLEVGASSMILAHNHPSGKLEPSRNDIELTNNICRAAQMIGLRVFDHVIVTNSGFYSFRANFLIK